VTDPEPCALYVRASLDATGEELSVTRQEEDGNALIQARGWRRYRLYVENDTTASGKVERPVFDQMMADFLAGHFRIIVARNMDRVTRNRRDRLRLLELGEQRGILLAFWRGTDLDLSTPAGRLTADILASVARHEIEEMADRRRRANQQKAEMGAPAGGRRAFGYCQHGKKHPLCPDRETCSGSMLSIVPEEADALRKAAETVISGGKNGLWRATLDLNAAGLRTTAGNPWHHTELREALLNPRYAGRRYRNGVDVAPAQWPAILDGLTATAVRAILKDPARARQGAPARYLLSGIARCGECRAPIHGSPTPRYQTYVCATRRHVAVRASWVDSRVVTTLVERAARDDFLELFAAPDGGEELPRLRARERALHTRKTALAQAFAAGAIDMDQLVAGTAQLNAEMVEVTSSLARSLASPAFADLLDTADVGARIRGWYDTDLRRLRDLLAAAGSWTLWSPGRGARSLPDGAVRVDWRR
jgi:DNA invertase Pin-like site-specific DNA recombinase